MPPSIFGAAACAAEQTARKLPNANAAESRASWGRRVVIIVFPFMVSSGVVFYRHKLHRHQLHRHKRLAIPVYSMRDKKFMASPATGQHAVKFYHHILKRV